MKSVRCFVTQSDSGQQEECRLFLKGDRVVADPPDSSTARMILDRKGVGPEGRIDRSAGAVCLEHLAANYSGVIFGVQGMWRGRSFSEECAP